jgi:hypothetical protein
VRQSLLHSCTSTISRLGISLLKTVKVTAAVYSSLYSQGASPKPLSLPSTGQESDNIPQISLLHCPVFLINSRRLRFCATPPPPSESRRNRPLGDEGAPLLPKLRGHFAEFLRPCFSNRLSILYKTTSVGYKYGWHSGRFFLGARGLSDLNR